MSLAQLELLKHAQGTLHQIIHAHYKSIKEFPSDKDQTFGFMYCCNMKTGEISPFVHIEGSELDDHYCIVPVSISNWDDEIRAHICTFNFMFQKWQEYHKWIPGEIVNEIKYLTVREVKQFGWHPYENLEKDTIAGIYAPNMYWVPIVDGSYKEQIEWIEQRKINNEL